MKVLLDTHMILWSLTNNPKLSAKAKTMISDTNNSIVCSTASFWEIQIKHLLYPNQLPPADEVIRYCKKAGYSIIPINYLETVNIRNLHTDSSHKDPFDRILISQAKTYGMSLLTADEALTEYKEPCVINAYRKEPAVGTGS